MSSWGQSLVFIALQKTLVFHTWFPLWANGSFGNFSQSNPILETFSALNVKKVSTLLLLNASVFQAARLALQQKKFSVQPFGPNVKIYRFPFFYFDVWKGMESLCTLPMADIQFRPRQTFSRGHSSWLITSRCLKCREPANEGTRPESCRQKLNLAKYGLAL